MSPKFRKDGLPKRWEFAFGAYYYRPHIDVRHLWDGKTKFRLGTTLAAAHRVYASRITKTEPGNSVDHLLERYALEVIPTKKIRTQDTELPLIPLLRKAIGHIPLHGLEPVHMYQILDAVTSPSKGNRMVAIVSHACTYGIRWGLLRNHPIKNNVVKHRIAARDRYVEDEELTAAYAIAPPLIRAYLPVKLCLGVRKMGLLRVLNADVTETVFEIKESKSYKGRTYEMTETLSEAVKQARELMPKDIAPWVFHTRKGTCYADPEKDTCSSFDSVWQRWMTKCVAAGIERFCEHDIRGKTASDSATDDRAQQLLGSSMAVIKKHYRRKPQLVTPHEGKIK